jgi:FkbM family methyltransferase
MYSTLKSGLRDLLPMRYQVPLKYWYSAVRRTLEPEMKLISLILKNSDRVIDIGGNRGVYAYQFWRRGVKVEVFEPNPICYSVLEAWAADKPNVNVYPVALSARVGTANLHIPVDGSGIEHDASASIEHIGFAKTRDQLVSLQTLDSYQFDGVGLIKIDVEGHEYSVIAGATKTLTSSRPALLVEIEQRHIDKPIQDVFESILVLGYQGFFLGVRSLMPLAEFEAPSHQSMENFGTGKVPYVNNFLFLHRSRVASEEYRALLERGFST